MAEIEYEAADGQSAVYRKSAGAEDHSGGLNGYLSTKKITVGSKEVELRGNGEGYTLAVWTDGSCAYSLNLTAALGQEAWAEIIKEIK